MTTLDELIEDLERASRDIGPELKKVVSRGSVQIKNEWRERWSGHPHIKGLPFTIGYDLYEEPDRVRSVIGPDKLKGQGPLGNLIEFEFGSPKSHPIPAGVPALAAEEPKFVRAIADLGEKLLAGKR